MDTEIKGCISDRCCLGGGGPSSRELCNLGTSCHRTHLLLVFGSRLLATCSQLNWKIKRFPTSEEDWNIGGGGSLPARAVIHGPSFLHGWLTKTSHIPSGWSRLQPAAGSAEVPCFGCSGGGAACPGLSHNASDGRRRQTRDVCLDSWFGSRGKPTLLQTLSLLSDVMA